MKRITLSCLFVFLISLNLVNASGSLFSYDSQALNDEFSQLIQIENTVYASNSSINDLTIDNELFQSMILFQDDPCSKAKADASIRYKATGPFWGAFCCSGGTNPLFGVVLALVMNGKTPKDSNLNLADYSLLSDTEYITCYRSTALEMKKKQVWKGVGLGTALYCVFLIINFAAM